MEYVKHNEWFYTEIDGVEYRAKYFNYGGLYSSIKFQVFKATNFFGIKEWKTLIECVESIGVVFPHSNLDGTEIYYATHRAKFYDSRKAKADIISCLNQYNRREKIKKERIITNRV